MLTPLLPPTSNQRQKTALAALCGVGGAVGYAKKGSVPSLVAGAALGAAYGASAYLVQSGDPVTGFGVGTAASAVLAAAMGARLVRTGKLMPAGVLTALGLAGGYYNLTKYREWTA